MDLSGTAGVKLQADGPPDEPLRPEDAPEALDEVPELEGRWQVRSGWMRGGTRCMPASIGRQG